jgi:hypothetical protein
MSGVGERGRANTAVQNDGSNCQATKQADGNDTYEAL